MSPFEYKFLSQCRVIFT